MNYFKVLIFFLLSGFLNSTLSKPPESENQKKYGVYYQEMTSKRMTLEEFAELKKKADEYMKKESSAAQLFDDIAYTFVVKVIFFVMTALSVMYLAIKGIYLPKKELDLSVLIVFVSSFVFLGFFESVIYSISIYVLIRIFYFYRRI